MSYQFHLPYKRQHESPKCERLLHKTITTSYDTNLGTRLIQAQ
jgi:hypothetical protein